MCDVMDGNSNESHSRGSPVQACSVSVLWARPCYRGSVMAQGGRRDRQEERTDFPHVSAGFPSHAGRPAQQVLSTPRVSPWAGGGLFQTFPRCSGLCAAPGGKSRFHQRSRSPGPGLHGNRRPQGPDSATTVSLSHRAQWQVLACIALRCRDGAWRPQLWSLSLISPVGIREPV